MRLISSAEMPIHEQASGGGAFATACSAPALTSHLHSRTSCLHSFLHSRSSDAHSFFSSRWIGLILKSRVHDRWTIRPVEPSPFFMK